MIVTKARLRSRRRLREHAKSLSISPVDAPSRDSRESGTVSQLIVAASPQWLCSVLVVFVEVPAEHVVTAFADPYLEFADRWGANPLNRALAHAQLALSVVCADTCGGVSPHLDDVWNELFARAEPHVWATARSTGVALSLVEDCVQEIWLTLWSSLLRFDADPECGNLACCLRTVARRTAYRVQREEERAAILEHVLPIRLPCVGKASEPDPHQSEPLAQLIQQETEAAVTAAIESLQTEVSPDAHRLVHQFLADSSSLSCLPPRLGMTAGHFWNLWRTVKTRLRTRLSSYQP
jgi:DNA-directed RNA polymerase specialized sigma24 family protein